MTAESERTGTVAAFFRPGSRAAPGHGQRTPRDRVVDILFVLVGAGLSTVGFATFGATAKVPVPPDWLNLAMGLTAGAALLLRRRWPVEVAVVPIVASVYFPAVGFPSALALFSLAIHRRPLVSGPAGVLGVVAGGLQFWLFPPVEPGPGAYWIAAGFVGMLSMALVAWGIVVRTRRQLLRSLAERARRAEAEQELRVEQGQRRERERIAREMHDALGYRLSLLSVHAGAIEFRPEMPAEELAASAGVVRVEARECLDDLRAIVGVLRGPGPYGPGDEDAGGRSRPGIDQVGALVGQSVAAGMRIAYEPPDADLTGLPAATGRHGYRIVQEGLTNAHKHAPGAVVHVHLDGTPGAGLTIEVRNRLVEGGAGPGTRVGLVGLGERAALAGGRLEHGRTPDGEFRLWAWLPWP